MIANTYCVSADSKVVAMFSICNDVISFSKSKMKRLFKQGHRYDDYPAVKLTRIGTDVDYQGLGIGSIMVTLIKTFFTIKTIAACRFITVNAYNNEKTLNFYSKNDFLFLTPTDESEELRTMYYDLRKYHNILAEESELSNFCKKVFNSILLSDLTGN